MNKENGHLEEMVEYSINDKKIYVAEHRLVLDERVKNVAQGIIDLNKHEEGKILMNINWYEAMLILQRLGSRGLTLQEYWKIGLYEVEYFNEGYYYNDKNWIGGYNGGEWIGCLVKNKKELVENIKVTKCGDKYFYYGNIRKQNFPKKEGFFEENDVINGIPTILYSMKDYEAECTWCYKPPTSDLTAILHKLGGELYFALKDIVPVWQINLSNEPLYSHPEIGVREVKEFIEK